MRAVEVSRLARSSPDWQRLLSLCAVAETVVIDEQAICDPAVRDDKLLLDIKGTMSEAELHPGASTHWCAPEQGSTGRTARADSDGLRVG